MAGPLNGLRILDLTTVLMGPIATQILADMGAEVIKVESPDGDVIRNVVPARHSGMGAAFINANRGKRGIVLDLKQPKGREALLRLAERADALVYSLRPSTMEGLGLGYEDCRRANPKLVYCGAYGFVEEGPYGGQPAYDDVIQASSGLAAIQAFTTAEPRYVPSVMADKIVGLSLVYAVTMGLLHRERTGEGQRVDVPMLETMVQFNLFEHTAGMQFVPPEGGAGYVRMQSEHRRPYRTADGHVAALPYTKRHWQRFFAIVGMPEMIEDERVTNAELRSRKVGDLYAKVTPALASWKTADILKALRDADIPCGPVNRLDDLPEDPHLKATGFLQQVEHPTEGTLLQAGVPIRFSASPGRPGRPAPRLGEHSVEVLAEAGYSEAEIRAMLATEAAVDGR
jgi:crotonobetainyl-CoA:carnitine CoA-transferase CaiB-like acyl-CoA transferase